MTSGAVRRAGPEDAGALAAFFLACGSRCYCQYWQFEQDHRAWQVACAQHPEENARRLAEDLEAGRLRALLSEGSGRINGWLRLEREAGLSKLYQGRLYKGLPCFTGERTKGAAVACMLVLPSVRRGGVARALLMAAVQDCRAEGDRFLEAFPRGQSDVSDEEQWMGPLQLYLELGFHVVHDFGPYPVLRRTFAGSDAGLASD